MINEISNKDLSKIFNIADKSSNSIQRIFKYIFCFQLLLLTLISIISAVITISDKQHHKTQITIICILYVVSLLVTIILKYTSLEKKWYNYRASSESIKSLVWKYMIGGAPFELSKNQSEVDTLFVEIIQKIIAEIKESKLLNLNGISNIKASDTMITVRNLSFNERLELYCKQRIGKQKNWYADKAKSNKDSSIKYFIILIVLQVLIVTFLIYLIYTPDFPIKSFSLFSTVISSILAWSQLNRFQELSQSYSIASQELKSIMDKFDEIKNDLQLSQFVADSEAAISREHIMWLARRGVK